MQSRKKYSTKKKGGKSRKTRKNVQKGGLKLGFKNRLQRLATKGAKRAKTTRQLSPETYQKIHEFANKNKIAPELLVAKLNPEHKEFTQTHEALRMFMPSTNIVSIGLNAKKINTRTTNLGLSPATSYYRAGQLSGNPDIKSQISKQLKLKLDEPPPAYSEI